MNKIEIEKEKPTLRKLAKHFKKAKEQLGYSYQLINDKSGWSEVKLAIADMYTDLDITIKHINRFLKEK